MWKKYLALGAAVWILSGVSMVSHASETVSAGEPEQIEMEVQEQETEMSEMPVMEQTDVSAQSASVTYATSGKYIPYEWAEYSLKYEVRDNGVVITGITDYYSTNVLGELVIPMAIDGVKVTEIGDNAFYHCSGLTGDLTIPAGVTTIGNDAFFNCSGLTGELIIPDGVTKIGKGAFHACSGLTGELIIPAGVTEIENDAFHGCRGLTGELIIPEGVTTIGVSAFGGCSGLTGDLIIPEGVTTIGGYAFEGCSGLTGELIIPEGVMIIGDSAFRNCSGLTGELIIPTRVTEIGRETFSGCSGLTGELIIPAGVTIIGDSAFLGCSGLTGGLIIPAGVKTIGESAFEGCSGLTGELIIPTGVTKIGNWAFSSCYGIRSVEVPASVEELGQIVGNNSWGGIKHITVLGKQTEIPRGLGYTFVHAYSDSVVAKEVFKWGYTFIPIDNAPEITEYRVSTVKELKDAIGTAGKGSYCHIILADGIYNISETIKLERLVSVTLEAEHPGKAEIRSQYKNAIAVYQCTGIEIIGCILSSYGQSLTVKDLLHVQDSYDVKVKLYGQPVIMIVFEVNMEVSVSMTMEEQKIFASNLAVQEGITVAEGEEVTVEITVSDAENTFTAQDKETVDQSAKAGRYKVGRYFDIAMSIQAGDNSRQVTHTSEPLRLVIEIPLALRQAGRVFSMIRLHDGKADLLRDLDSDPKTITIETDRFSSYTIVYKDTVGENGSISGTVTSFGDATKGALIQLLDGAGNVIAQTTAAAGSSGAYELEVVEQGNYTLTVSKAGHVTRSYAVTLDGEAPELNAEIRLKGDVNGDGKVDSLDKRMIFGHIAGSTTLTGYEFQVGDVDGSGRIDALDKRMIYGHIAGTSPL